MNLRSPSFPGKTQVSKPRTVQKPVHGSNINPKEPLISRQKRVFGTVKNPNIPSNTLTDKPIKPSISDKKTEPKSSKLTNIASNPLVETSKNKNNSTEKLKAKLNKKSTCFMKQKENNPSISQAHNLSEPATPVASRSCNKPRIISTPYHSAENCSKCRFDKLETSSYWLGQIKLAESVSKHFVSASFFRLACESKAEPIRNLLNELKRYLVRHEHLRKETEWTEVSVAYGLLKDENSNMAERHDLAVIEAGPGINISKDLEQDQKKLKEPDEAERN